MRHRRRPAWAGERLGIGRRRTAKRFAASKHASNVCGDLQVVLRLFGAPGRDPSLSEMKAIRVPREKRVLREELPAIEDRQGSFSFVESPSCCVLDRTARGFRFQDFPQARRLLFPVQRRRSCRQGGFEDEGLGSDVLESADAGEPADALGFKESHTPTRAAVERSDGECSAAAPAPLGPCNEACRKLPPVATDRPEFNRNRAATFYIRPPKFGRASCSW